MLNLRVFVTAELSPAVIDALRAHPGVGNLAVMAGASHQPPGDLIIADVAREAANSVIEELRALGVHHEGAIQIEHLQTWLSRRGYEAEELAPGDGADAVIWADVVQRSYEDSKLNFTFVSMLALAIMIAVVGIVLDSTLLIVGAMVVGPEFGPVSSIAVGLVRGHASLVRRAVSTLIAGFAIAIAIGTVFALVLRLAGWTTDADLQHAETSFIYHPDKWSLLVAVLAGVTGVLALTSAKSSVLVGVFISVTTVPAAGNICLGITFAEWGQVSGSLLQLAINLAGIGFAGWMTLVIQEKVWQRLPRSREARSAAAIDSAE